MADPQAMAREVIDLCHAQGFARAGVCAARESEHEAALRDWLAAGKHGSMGWLAERVEQRLDPGRFFEGAKSLILVADQYASRAEGSGGRSEEAGARIGKVARYARGDDYHIVMKKRLHAVCDALAARFPDERFRAFVDTAPVLEREHAARAGLGWIGKHTLLIDPERGSYLLLGGIATTLDLEAPAEQRRVEDHCGTCTRCIDACPTDAITPWSVDATRCISYLTIERREMIDPGLFEGMGDWIFGCDVCQEVCPHNSARAAGVRAGEVHPAYAPRREGFDLLEVLGWDEEARREAFRKSSMKRARLEMMKRNALIAAGNRLRVGDDAALRRRIEEIAADGAEDAMVRETAALVLASLSDRA
ncbi:MAG: tRNA epoxyqueuosine(34) reductase QueG [Planctomycetota bacterium]|nr:tRNA epoxyqueuosine(34) reductase QueG [Planctomycetota bacterium]